jgi:hypothetical protein
VEVGELSEARVHHQGGVPLWNETVWVRLLPSAPFEILLHYPPPPSSSSPLSSPASAEHRPWRMFVKRSRAWIPASWREMNLEVLLPSSPPCGSQLSRQNSIALSSSFLVKEPTRRSVPLPWLPTPHSASLQRRRSFAVSCPSSWIATEPLTSSTSCRCDPPDSSSPRPHHDLFSSSRSPHKQSSLWTSGTPFSSSTSLST